MTYIVGGKFNQKTFLMVDSIVSDKNGEIIDKTFKIKLKKLDSSKDTYFCLTGPEFFSTSLQMLDEFFLHTNIKSDFINNNHDIEKLKETIQKIGLARKNNKLKKGMFFFINKNDVFCVDIELDSLNNVNLRMTPFKIDNGKFFISPNLGGGVEKIDTITTSLYNFCKERIELLDPNEDFKDKFSFIEYDGKDLKVKQPIYHFSDIYAMVFETPYSEIDNNKWDLK
tara:strand:- start:2418 stop:3095 length:678 start_codon:yes stop_codon:yes gene_type:complete